ncbi:MAG: sigma-70 family RNA polymerase sigma factor [Burkholderiales bacterium]|nr:sigma-70 family RNA polymerase sigma factor [Burkholderiales bacterium]
MSTNLKQIENETAATLLTKIAQGNTKAMEEFYRMFSRTVYAFVLRRLDNQVEAEEVVVEAMYEVWRNAGSFAGRSAPRTWLLGIARHKLLDKLRASHGRPFEPLEEEAENISADEPSMFERLAQKQTQEQVLSCLESLPEEQRECIHLMFYEDLSIAEIAEIQQCPENTIKTRLFHARRKLKINLERQTRWQPDLRLYALQR